MPKQILVIRMGAMGDIIHALPAVMSLKKSFPGHQINWIVAPRWKPLLEGNPSVDRMIDFDRRSFTSIKRTWRTLRALRPLLCVDFQGLIQSALVGSVARPERFVGFAGSSLREPAASWFYSSTLQPSSAHIVDQYLDLATAAGAHSLSHSFPLPPGKREGNLPGQPYVLANPLAGWIGKQWPLENYIRLAEMLKERGLAFVMNISPASANLFAGHPGISIHTSSLEGLIGATRDAAAVIGVDSGPLHLAAALRKPGVAIFGPTDPARNGPYGDTIRVLRDPAAVTTYKRGTEIDPSMRAIHPEHVFQALMEVLSSHPTEKHS